MVWDTAASTRRRAANMVNQVEPKSLLLKLSVALDRLTTFGWCMTRKRDDPKASASQSSPTRTQQLRRCATSTTTISWGAN